MENGELMVRRRRGLLPGHFGKFRTSCWFECVNPYVDYRSLAVILDFLYFLFF